MVAPDSKPTSICSDTTSLHTNATTATGRISYGDRDENDVIQRAALYHLSQMRDGFKRASEDLALELGIRLSDIVPENYDPQLEAMNNLDERSAAGDFIRRRFGKELHAAFKRGGYVGGDWVLPRVGEGRPSAGEKCHARKRDLAHPP